MLNFEPLLRPQFLSGGKDLKIQNLTYKYKHYSVHIGISGAVVLEKSSFYKHTPSFH